MPDFRTSRGKPLPLGALAMPDKVINFALLCRHGTEVTLVILPEAGGNTPLAEYRLTGKQYRTGDHWHIAVQGLPDTFCYGWKVDGPAGPRHRFDRNRMLLDPVGRIISAGEEWAATCEIDPARTSRRSLFHRQPRYEWEDDAPPLTPHEDSIIYEVHVRGFTCDPSSGVRFPGTYAGLTEKIPYLKELGITAVELMPVFEWDECDCPFTDPTTGEKLTNFWGYQPIGFAAPKAALAATARTHGQLIEFREMVKAFHKAGIEVILDVVFNHTGEGNDRGRTYSFRGLDNELYYVLDANGNYLDFAGCGNTVNCNHPVVRDQIMQCLRYWVGDMHVDGFRFDLASVLGRDRRGNVMIDPPVIEAITEDGVLADTKLIAEPWDAAGLYQVGGFPFGRRWSEWNGKYRDDVRRFWRGDAGLAGVLAARVCGSADIYQWSSRLPRHTVNFVTCHDGFTLNDLVSYDRKHNEANGEENRDGLDDNCSWNCGAEGPTDDATVNALRARQARNMMATMMLSQGVPMLLAGDEFLRTQRGNNNAWCQDNDVSWVDWRLAETNTDFLRFTREMIALRKRHPALRRRRFFVGPVGQLIPGIDLGPFPPGGPVRPADAGLPPGSTGDATAAARRSGEWATAGLADVHWHGVEPFQPDFGEGSRTLAFALDGRFTGRELDDDYRMDTDFYVAMNAWIDPVDFVVPRSPTRRPWRRVVDTAAAPPADFLVEGTGPVVAEGDVLRLAAHSLVVLVSEP